MIEPHTAVVDRIVDETAVLVFEESPGQSSIDVTVLPADARHKRAVVEVTLSGETVEEIKYRPERERRERAQERFDRLPKRLGEE